MDRIGKTRQARPAPPRGALQRVDGESLHYWNAAPAPDLADRIEHLWCVRWDLRGLPPQVQETLPHPNVHLVVETSSVAAWGVQTGRFTKKLEGHGLAFGVKFHPGAFRPLLGRPVSSLMDAAMPAEQLFGAAASGLDAVRDASSDAESARVVTQFLRAHLPPADARAVEARRLVRCIVEDPGLRSVAQLAARSGVGARTLQRLFGDYVGVAPKWVINRCRIHEAVVRVQQGVPVSWADLAHELGFFDQAHFIADFRRLVGRTPLEYARLYAEGGAA